MRRLDELDAHYGWREVNSKMEASPAESRGEAIDALWGVLDAERKLAAAREAAGVGE